MNQQEVYALATLVGWKNCGYEKIENDYWPKHADYDHLREKYPWWRITTEFGAVVVGWRKRVIAIDWSETNRRGIVTTDDTTKDTHMVHAWNLGNAVTYMKAIQSLPIVDVTLPAFREYVLTEPKEVRTIVHDFTDRDSLEGKLMVHMLEQTPDDVPLRLQLCSKKDDKSQDRFVLHIGGLRVECMSKRNWK